MQCPTSRGDKSVDVATVLRTLTGQKEAADLTAKRQIVCILSKKSRTSAKMRSLTVCLGWTTFPKVGLGSIAKVLETSTQWKCLWFRLSSCDHRADVVELFFTRRTLLRSTSRAQVAQPKFSQSSQSGTHLHYFLFFNPCVCTAHTSALPKLR